jgi:methylmalonyl-CoA/ethylmalonyl-CoA epimerase
MPTSLLGPIGQIAITVRDLERAVAFYRDKLGLPLLFQVPGMAFFDCQGIRLMLSLPEKSGEAYSSILYYRAEDNPVDLRHFARARREGRS